MLSISRSRYRLPLQLLFLALNALGVLLATIYNASTPDLYPNNAHHKLGWVLTWVAGAHLVMGLASAYTQRKDKLEERVSLIPVSTEAMAEHHRIHNPRQAETGRFSGDSGQGTEPNTESLRSQSISSTGSDDHHLPSAYQDRAFEHKDTEEKDGVTLGSKVDRYLAGKISRLLSSRVLRIVQLFYDVVDRLILILGFVALTTGIVTYGGLFVSSALSQSRDTNID